MEGRESSRAIPSRKEGNPFGELARRRGKRVLQPWEKNSPVPFRRIILRRGILFGRTLREYPSTPKYRYKGTPRTKG